MSWAFDGVRNVPRGKTVYRIIAAVRCDRRLAGFSDGDENLPWPRGMVRRYPPFRKDIDGNGLAGQWDWAFLIAVLPVCHAHRALFPSHGMAATVGGRRP